MASNDTTTYHIPARQYGIVDAHNRMAAALGSPRYGARCAHADYNGHTVRVRFNSFRNYYVAEFTWAGRRVIARGSFAACLTAAANYYAQGALGAAVDIEVPSGDADAIAACDAHEMVKAGRDDMAWHGWRHTVAARCARDSARPASPVRIFDVALLEAADSVDAYDAALKASHGRVFA